MAQFLNINYLKVRNSLSHVSDSESRKFASVSLIQTEIVESSQNVTTNKFSNQTWVKSIRRLLKRK
jgi:hypothetical protein